MNRDERRKYVFAQLNSLPNAFQYVEVTNYIKSLEQENEKLNHYKLLYQKVKERNDKAVEYMKPRFMNCIDNEKRYFADYDIQQIYEILEGFNEEVNNGK